MGETELERMIVRIIGDSASFESMLRQAQNSAVQAATNIESSANRIEQFSKSVAGFASNAMTVLGNFGIKSDLRGVFNAFEDGEKNAARLKAVIEATGVSVESVMPGYDRLTKALMAETLATKGSIKALFEKAAVMQVTGPQAESLVTNALALAQGNAEEAKSMIAVVKAAEAGNWQLVKLRLGMRGIKDESDVVTQYQGRLKAGLELAKIEANSTSGSITKLQRSLAGFTKEIGALISTVVRPIIDGLRYLTEQFNNMNPAVKQVVVGLLAVAVVWKNWAFIMGYITPVITLLSSLAGLLTGPLGIGLAIVGTLAYILIQRFGGFEEVWKNVKEWAINAWKYIQEKIAQFIVWVSPITKALTSLWNTVWEGIVFGVNVVWDYVVIAFNYIYKKVSDVWEWLTGITGLTWEDVRRSILVAIIACEFALRNFSKVAEYVWASIKYYALAAFNFIVNNVLAFFIKSNGLILLGIYEAFKLTFVGIGEFILWSMRLTVEGITSYFSAMWVAIKTGAKIDFTSMGVDFANSFSINLKGIKIPALDELEKQYKAEKDALGSSLGESFEEFKKRRLEEFSESNTADTVNAAAKLGIDVGDNYSKEAKKHSEKFEASLSSSVEAAARTLAFLEHLEYDKGGSMEGKGGRNEVVAKFDATRGDSAEAKSREEQTRVLVDIRDVLKEKKNDITVEPAALA